MTLSEIEIGWYTPSVELDDGTHGDGGGQKMDQVLQLGKEKNKNRLKAKVYLIRPFLFRQSRHHRMCDWV